MMRLVILLTTCFALAGCTDVEGAKRALEAEGFEKVSITGYRFFGCGKEDFHTGFRACRGAKCTTGVVCSGWFKGGTIRHD